MRICVTTRRDPVEGRDELRDGLDSSWLEIFDLLSITPFVVPNSLTALPRFLDEVKPEGFLLTGGNDLAHLPSASNPALTRDAVEVKILDLAKKLRLPVVGVCRGFQIINDFEGGQLVPVGGHVASRHALELIGETSHRLPDEVNSFHSWGITGASLAKSLKPIAKSKDGYVEAAEHQSLPWLGIMWHPERERPFKETDLALLSAFFQRKDSSK